MRPPLPSVSTLPIVAALRHWSLHTAIDGDGDKVNEQKSLAVMRGCSAQHLAQEGYGKKRQGGERHARLEPSQISVLNPY